jgi:hypothetical protein
MQVRILNFDLAPHVGDRRRCLPENLTCCYRRSAKKIYPQEEQIQGRIFQ